MAKGSGMGIGIWDELWELEFSFGWSGCDWFFLFVVSFLSLIFKVGSGSIPLVTSQGSSFVSYDLFSYATSVYFSLSLRTIAGGGRDECCYYILREAFDQRGGKMKRNTMKNGTRISASSGRLPKPVNLLHLHGYIGFLNELKLRHSCSALFALRHWTYVWTGRRYSHTDLQPTAMMCERSRRQTIRGWVVTT